MGLEKTTDQGKNDISRNEGKSVSSVFNVHLSNSMHMRLDPELQIWSKAQKNDKMND